MARFGQYLVVSFFTASISLCALPRCASGESYDLSTVNGIEAFNGSAAAREILARNGFVVADPAFRQIFEGYIKSPETAKPSESNPRGTTLPSFITTDSAWHTYHVLLEEGVKGMEEIQSRNLLNFSRQLLAAITNQNLGPAGGDLALFASVGLGLQDEPFRQSLGPEAKRIVDGLRTGSAPVEIPIGLPLSPPQFRAQSFYTQSPELSDYFSARQWYASVVFRLANPRETRIAIALATLINSNADLLALWKQLSDPLDAFLATAEDGTIREYAGAAKTVLGTNTPASSITDQQIAELQKRLEGQLPLPRVNDQLLSPDQYADYGKQTRGFRLLPPRRLPCAVCFQNTVDPKIPNRLYPSGLDFMAASPVLRSPAAVRAVQSEFGKSVGDVILKTDCGPLPDSLHGAAMQLLSTLQKPLPPQAPACMRTEAWADLQLWTQLGAWAEQRHTWALHTKINVSYMGIISPPKGIVAPYPDFFSGLAGLTRRTAAAFAQAGLDQPFEVKTAANDLSELLKLSHGQSRGKDEKELEKLSGKLEQLSQFQNQYYEKHRAELEKDGQRDAYKKLEQEIEDLARRCAESGTANEADTETLRTFFEARQSIVRLLNNFAPVCDRLAVLAKKSLAGEALTEEDAKWIEGYGVTLATFHFYYGNSYEVPRNDFPIVTRIFSSPLTDSMLYAGLARPQALYVIVADGNSKQLYRGAVMTYREFVRPNDQLLDDESWRELISKGQTPPAPPFTRSFYAETSVPELLKRLRDQAQKEDPNHADTEDILWQLNSRATEKDLPELFQMLVQTNGGDIVDGLAEIIGRLPWESRQKQVDELLASSDNLLSKAAARLLIEHPAGVDSALLTSDFARQPPQKRRLVCAILGRLPQPSQAARQTLLVGLQDTNSGIRWQAVLAMSDPGWNDAQNRSALEHVLDDANQFVAAAAAYSLARSGATNSAPLLFKKLETALAANPVPIETLELQSREIIQDMRGDENHALSVLDPYRLETRLFVSAQVAANVKRAESTRRPPQPFSLPSHFYSLADALIEALGELHYAPAADKLFQLQGTEYDSQAATALKKLAPDRLTANLLAIAKDKQGDSYLRERAMVTLCKISATNCVRELIPLLDDTTPIVYSRSLPGPEWRICDRAGTTIAILLGWQHEMQTMILYARNDQRQAMMARVREWAKSTP